MVTPEIKTTVTGVWIDVGLSDKKMSMTMRPESPLYDPDCWLRGRDGAHIATVNAYTSGDYAQINALAKKETGLDILEHDTDYDCFSFFVDISKDPTWKTIEQVRAKLAEFVGRHYYAIKEKD